jgi:hypothetical protein
MSDVQEVYMTLTEIDKLLADIELKITKIGGEATGAGGNSGGAVLSLRRQFRVLNMISMSIEAIAGNKNIDVLAQKFNQTLMLGMRVYMMLNALNAASGPWGLAYAGITMLGVGISYGNLMSVGE